MIEDTYENVILILDDIFMNLCSLLLNRAQIYILREMQVRVFGLLHYSERAQ